MQLPSTWRFFVLQFLLEFQRKIIDFGVLFDAIIFGVSIFSWFHFWTNFDKKKHRFGCAFWCNYLRRVDFLWFNFCSNFDENSLMLDFVWIHTKNHWFWRAFWCNYLRRVDFLCLYFGSNSDEKSSIFAWFLMLLPAACWFFRGSVFAPISTKNHRF